MTGADTHTPCKETPEEPEDPPLGVPRPALLLPRDRTKETLVSEQKGTRGRGETNLDCVRTLLHAAWASSHLIFSQHHKVGPVRIFFPFYT